MIPLHSKNQPMASCISRLFVGMLCAVFSALCIVPSSVHAGEFCFWKASGPPYKPGGRWVRFFNFNIYGPYSTKGRCQARLNQWDDDTEQDKDRVEVYGGGCDSCAEIHEEAKEYYVEKKNMKGPSKRSVYWKGKRFY